MDQPDDDEGFRRLASLEREVGLPVRDRRQLRNQLNMAEGLYRRRRKDEGKAALIARHTALLLRYRRKIVAALSAILRREQLLEDLDPQFVDDLDRATRDVLKSIESWQSDLTTPQDFKFKGREYLKRILDDRCAVTAFLEHPDRDRFKAWFSRRFLPLPKKEIKEPLGPLQRGRPAALLRGWCLDDDRVVPLSASRGTLQPKKVSTPSSSKVRPSTATSKSKNLLPDEDPIVRTPKLRDYKPLLSRGGKKTAVKTRKNRRPPKILPLEGPCPSCGPLSDDAMYVCPHIHVPEAFGLAPVPAPEDDYDFGDHAWLSPAEKAMLTIGPVSPPGCNHHHDDNDIDLSVTELVMYMR